ncbi:MAG: tagatose 1,6-diphosphate aldolase [Limnochordales bacterium]|nr:tagatose-bisphosphate aldolase [Bacillota bacterium]REJ35803.1 MAG: tagatose-bisphosphate aldolase [Bacillota bacterium]
MALSMGKLRGLQQVSTEHGIFAILACDQRGALKRMMEKAGRTPITYEAVVQMKHDIVAPLAPFATGVLLDPEYGAAQLVTRGALPGRVGLVVALEETGYEEREGDRLTRLLEHWSVAKIKAMGAAAVKLLVYYNPRREAAAAYQRELVAQVARECQAYDIPFMLEPVTYPSRDGDEEAFIREKPDLVVETARHMSEFAVDLLKMEFPVHPAAGDDPGLWREACQRLDEACRVPWALLSAGVDFDTYCRQLETACRAGASGFVAGRAIWREAVEMADGAARQQFLAETMPARLRKLVDIASEHGRPWHARASHAYTAADAPPDWYASYPGFTG